MSSVQYSFDGRWYWDGQSWQPTREGRSDQRQTTWRPRLTRLLGVAIFALMGATGVAVGYHDVFVADAPLDRILAIPLLVVGSLSLISAIGYLRRRPWAYRSAAFVAIPATTLAIHLLLAPVRGQDWGFPTVLTAAVLLSPLLFLAYDYPWQRRPPTAFFSRVRNVGAGVAVGGLVLTLGQVWYTNQYVPSTIPISLNVTTALNKVGPVSAPAASGVIANRVGVQATIRIRNITSARVQVIGTVFHVTGVRLSSAILDDGAMVKQIQESGLVTNPNKNAPVSRYGTEGQSTVLEAGQMITPFGFYYEPGEETTYTYVVFLPPETTFQKVRIDATVFAAQAGRLPNEELREPQRQTYETKDIRFVQEVWRINQSSWLRQMMAPRDALAILWLSWEANPHLEGGAYPQLRLGSWDASNDRVNDLTPATLKKYGIAQTNALSELQM